jgi:hypothetical protein
MRPRSLKDRVAGRRDDPGGSRGSWDKAADTLWGQSASQRAGVAGIGEHTSLFSRQRYEAERERKRQLVSKMVGSSCSYP